MDQTIYGPHPLRKYSVISPLCPTSALIRDDYICIRKYTFLNALYPKLFLFRCILAHRFELQHKIWRSAASEGYLDPDPCIDSEVLEQASSYQNLPIANSSRIYILNRPG